MFLKTYHHNSCQSFFSIVLMPIVHPTMKSSVTLAILRKDSCIYSHQHVKQQVNLMDINNVNIHNERKNDALIDPSKKFLLFYSFQISVDQREAQEGEKNKEGHDQEVTGYDTIKS